MKTFSHKVRIACLGLLSLTVLMASSGNAAAVSCQAPPGTSGVDQYCENLPSAGGNNTHHGSKNNVSSKTKKALGKHGAAGAAVLALTGSGSAGGGSSSGKGSNGGGGSSGGTGGSAAESGAPAPAPGDSPLPAIKTAVQTGSSAGSAYVWALMALGLVLCSLAWLAYRRRTRTE